MQNFGKGPEPSGGRQAHLIDADRHRGNNLATGQSRNYERNGPITVTIGDPVLNSDRNIFDPLLEHKSCKRAYVNYLKKFGRTDIPIGMFPVNEDIAPSVENYKCRRPTQCPYYLVEVKHRNKRFSKWVEDCRKTIEGIHTHNGVDDLKKNDDNLGHDAYFRDFQLSWNINEAHRFDKPIDYRVHPPAGYALPRSNSNYRRGRALNGNSSSFSYPSDNYPINQNHNVHYGNNINKMNSAINPTNHTFIVPDPNKHLNNLHNPGTPIYNVNNSVYTRNPYSNIPINVFGNSLNHVYSDPNNSHHDSHNYASTNGPNGNFNTGFHHSSQPTPSHIDNNNVNNIYFHNPYLSSITIPSPNVVARPNHTVLKNSSNRNDTNSNHISTGCVSSNNVPNTSTNDDFYGFPKTSSPNAALIFLNQYIRNVLDSISNIYGGDKTSQPSSSSSCTAISTSTATTSSEVASHRESSHISFRTDKKKKLTKAKRDKVTATQPTKRSRKSSHPKKLRIKCE